MGALRSRTITYRNWDASYTPCRCRMTMRQRGMKSGGIDGCAEHGMTVIDAIGPVKGLVEREWSCRCHACGARWRIVVRGTDYPIQIGGLTPEYDYRIEAQTMEAE